MNFCVKAVAAFFVLLGIVACDVPVTGTADDAKLATSIKPYSNAALKTIEVSQNILFFQSRTTVDYHAETNSYASYDNILDGSLQSFTQGVARELSLYPPGALNAMGIKYILFVNRLVINGQPRLASPLFEKNAMIVDISTPQYFLAHTIHHELFHSADYQMHHDIRSDSSWEHLNPTGFSYGTGGQNMRSSTAAVWNTDHLGFLNDYGTSALEEDKAELFAALMESPAQLQARESKDPYLSRKVERLKKLLIGLNPRFSSDFWLRVQSSR